MAGRRASIEFRFEPAAGGWILIEARGRDLTADPAVGGIVVYARDLGGHRGQDGG